MSIENYLFRSLIKYIKNQHFPPLNKALIKNPLWKKMTQPKYESSLIDEGGTHV